MNHVAVNPLLELLEVDVYESMLQEQDVQWTTDSGHDFDVGPWR